MRISKYVKQYTVKSHEADCHGFLRVLSLLNILQDVATENADIIGVGLDICRKHNLSWVGANYLLKIERFPHEHEKFSIATWPAETKLCSVIRDFEVLDEGGNAIIKATSQWVLIDIERRRPVVIKKYFTDYETINERAVTADFMKTYDFPAAEAQYEYRVRFDDIDINKHVNNAVYALWATESVEPAYRFEHLPQEIEICYKKEALYGTTVVVQTQMLSDESLHCVRNKNSDSVLALCRIKWQKISN